MADTATDLLHVTIDGREVEARPGELVIEAAERAGVFIPRFCYHPRMKPVGMCRMCLVEISSPRGPSLQPACFVTVADGQEVATDSPAARKAQEGVLEFLLINHPLDCPVCDQGGECPLQDQAMSHGPGESRFVEEKRHWAKPIALGPLVLLDRERCIQCARCTRFAEEIAGEPLIDFFERGDRIEVAIFPDAPFDSYFSANTVQICPVGALTAAPYRFRSRPWDLEQVESTCTFCAVGCRVAVQSSAGTVVRFIGIDSDPVNQSWLCDRGRFGYEAVHSAERLGSPLVRRDGELEETGWNEALSAAASALKEALSSGGGGAVGIIGGARLPNEDQYAWSKLARAVLRTDNVDAAIGDGLPAELVSSLPAATIDDACSAKAVVLLGGELRDELPVLHLRLRTAAANHGLRLIDCSPVRSALSEVAATVVPSRPGEEAILAEALFSESGSAAPEHDRGPLDAGRRLLEGLAGSEVVVILGRTSIATSAEAVAAAAATIARARPGVRFLPALRRANARGAIDMGLAPGVLPGRVSLEAGRAWFEHQWGALPEREGLDCRAMLEAAAAGTLRTLVLLGADPLSDFPDRDLAERALRNVASLIAVDILPNPSVRLADVVLPAAGPTERGGTTTNVEGRVTRLSQKVVPPGVARADWVIASELAERLGFELGFEHVEGIFEEIEELAPSHRGITVESVYSRGGGDGVVVPLRGVTLRPARRLDPIATPGIDSVITQGAPLFAGAAQVPSGTTEESVLLEEEPAPRELEAETATALAAGPPRPAPASFDAARWSRGPLVSSAVSGLRLVTRRFLYDGGTLVQACPSLASLSPAAQLHVAREELDRLGTASGGVVKVRSDKGELRVVAVADDAVPDGVCWIGIGLAGSEESVTTLIDADEPAVTVRLEAVEQ